MKKTIVYKLCTALLASTFIVSLLAGCGGESTPETTAAAKTEADSEKTTADVVANTEAEDTEALTGGGGSSEDSYHIVMALFQGSKSEDEAKVTAAINELTEKELNMTYEMLFLSWGDWSQKLNLMLSSGDKLDVFPVEYNLAPSYVAAKQVVDLSDYIFEHGQDILRLVGEEEALSASVGGFIYGIPPQKESASLAGVVMRKDMVDACDIDVDSIKTLADLTEVYAKVKEVYPNVDCIAGTNGINQWRDHDILSNRLGVLMDDGQDTTVVNWYETDSYKSKAKLMSEWYQAGYMKLDAATTNIGIQDQIKAETLFSYFSTIKPGFLVQANSQAQTEMVYAYIGHDDGSILNTLNTNNVNNRNWGIAQNSEDKVKSMQFINFAYSNSDFMNLLNWGIEGEHWEFVDGSDNIIDYPAGVDDASVTWHQNMGWHFPNQYIAHIWNGLPEDIWDQYKAFNDSAVKSKAFGFLFDSTSVATEIAALLSVQQEYDKVLETGSSPDYEKTLQEYNDKLYASGLQKVMDLKQEQLDAWLAEQG